MQAKRHISHSRRSHLHVILFSTIMFNPKEAQWRDRNEIIKLSSVPCAGVSWDRISINQQSKSKSLNMS